jgi:uncharacterized membrane protein
MIRPDWIFEHTAPTPAIAGGLVLAVAVLLFSVWRWPGFSWLQAGLATIRIAFLAVLGWCLLMPSAREDRREVIRPRLLIAFDTSASMTNTPSPTVATRQSVARSLLTQDWVRVVASRCTVDLYPFDRELGARLEAAEAAHLPSNGQATGLRDSLSRLVDRLRGQDVVGVLLLSDGLDTREPSSFWIRQAWPFPIYTVRLEPPADWSVPPDVRVDGVDTPNRVTVGWNSELKATVSGEGCAGKLLSVKLLRDRETVQEVPTQLPAEGGSREVVFPLQHDTIGLFTYEVRVEPLEGEIQTNDNRYAVTVQVMDTKNRLLYVEGVPRWESKYLVRVLRGIASITPLAFVRGPDGRFISYGTRGASTLDLTETQLANYRIVVLGDLDADGLGNGRDAALAKFVEKGGSLVLLGGPLGWGPKGFAATALGRVMPVQRGASAPALEGRFPLTATAEGLAHPAFAGDPAWLSRLPPVLSVFPGSQPAPAAAVLVSAQTDSGVQPVIVFQRYGQGKVLGVLTDSLWRWQLERQDTADSYFRFWNQMLNWLLPAESEAAPVQIDLFADAERLYLGDTLTLNARYSALSKADAPPDALTCSIETPDGRALPFVMPRQAATAGAAGAAATYSVKFLAGGPGLYRATASVPVNGTPVESPAYSFFVKPFTPESIPRPPDLDTLRALAKAGNGRFLEPAEVAEAMTAIPIKPREEALVRFATLWNTIPVLACLIGLLALEWIVRKAKGLV